MNAPASPSLGRPLGLLVVIVLMAVAVFAIGNRLRDRASGSGEITSAVIDHGSPLDRIATEGNSFRRPVLSTPPGAGTRTDAVHRDLNVYYARRAFAGAPPQIPHVVEPDAHHAAACNLCHEQGGFVPSFAAYTPQTPHPEYLNCLQCHVAMRSEDLFVESRWMSVAPPPLHRPVLPGGPPPIPHALQLRDNCLTCHAGPAVPLEIRTTHPERLNCRQCHVHPGSATLFARTTSPATR